MLLLRLVLCAVVVAASFCNHDGDDRGYCTLLYCENTVCFCVFVVVVVVFVCLFVCLFFVISVVLF